MAAKTSLRDKVLAKKAFTKNIPIVINGEQLEITAKALDEKTLRDIRAAHPPRKEDKDNNLPYNVATFPADLLTHSVVDPVLTLEEWKEIFSSSEWSLGELRELYDQVFEITTSGFDVPFGARG